MRIGQDVALRGVDDDTRSRRLGFALQRLLLQVEKAAEQRILQQRVVFTHPAAHRDADNAGGYAANHRSQTLDRGATRLGYRRPGKCRAIGARHQSDPA